jgi:hypothetical protein
MLKTTTLQKFPEFTVEELYTARQSVELDGLKHVIKCSPEAYIALKDFCDAYDVEIAKHKYIKTENMSRRGKTYEEPINYWGSLFGIEIKLDPDLKPGEWKFG